jgi:23S rRNA (guanine2535-N1)-methyltransferase
MKFNYATTPTNYMILAAGHVIKTRPGLTSFPVRLASEVFQRSAAHLGQARLRVYDPCCGGGYLLTVLGFLHGDRIAALYGADRDHDAVRLARANLGLLTPAGLDARQRELARDYAAYGKESHALALQSLAQLRERRPAQSLLTATWTADALHPVLAPHQVDLLLTDVPYGGLASWSGTAKVDPLHALLDRQLHIRPALVAIISDKAQKAAHPGYRRLEHHRHGKRQITFLEPL